VIGLSGRQMDTSDEKRSTEHSNGGTVESDFWRASRHSVVVSAYCAVVAGGVEVAGVLLKDDKSSLLGTLSCLTKSATRAAYGVGSWSTRVEEVLGPLGEAVSPA
jgi:hypothetical protein